MSRVLAWYGVWMAVLSTATFAWPSEHIFLWTALGFSAVAAMLIGTWRNAPRRRAPWFLLTAAVACIVTGDLTIDVLLRVFHVEDPFPSIADVIYLLMYLLMAAGLVMLYRLGVVRRDSSSLMDALTITACVGLLSWIFLISPYVENPDLSLLQKAVSIAYPLSDLLVLAVGVRLLAALRPTVATVMLAIGLVGLLLSDVGYGLAQLGGPFFQIGTPVDIGWVAFLTGWGAAALHPSMRELTEPKVLRHKEQRLSRLVLLGLASLLAPTVLFIEVLKGDVHDGAVIAVLSAVLSVLVLVRLNGALRVQRRSVDRERGLRQAGAALLMATEVAGVTTVVGEAVSRLLPPGRPHRVSLTTTEAKGADWTMTGTPAWPETAPKAGDLGMAMVYTRTLDPNVSNELGEFEVTLRLPLTAEQRRTGGVRLGVLFIASDEVTLVGLQEGAQVLATQTALALERIVLSNEIDRRNSEAYFRTLVLNTADVILVVDDDDRIRYASPSASSLFMRPDVTGLTLVELVEADSVVDVRRRLDRVRAGAYDHHDRDWQVRRPGGRRALVEVTCRDLRSEPTVRNLVVTLRDVTDPRRLEDELYQRATFDSLTGLPNREVFLAAAQRAVDEAAEIGATISVIVVELDDFKAVNNTMGHGAGDELLEAVGERLAATARLYEVPRPADSAWINRSVCRIGGDEFAALVRHNGGPDDVGRIADRFMEVFTEPFALSDGVVPAAASIGVATTAGNTDAQELLRHADLAVYVAKDAGKGRWVQYEAPLHTAVVDRLKLRSDLERAVADGAFLLHYQPIVDMTNGRTVGFEALVRWDHPTRGLLPPAQFIDLAEESGLIVPLGAWVLHHAIAAAVQWRRLRPDDRVYVSVNVSARQFRAPGFVEQVRDELSRAGLPHECLTLEITESLLLRDGGVVSDELNTLRNEGTLVAIDDFGTGFSSLSYLRQLPVDVLKLDKTFIDTIASSPDQHSIVSAIIHLAQTLRLDVVAEGIETRDELILLASMGCGYGQGYLLSRPMSYRDAIRWLLDDRSSLPVDVSRTAA